MLTNITNLQEYTDCITMVQRYIDDHIDEALNREVLATVANFSVPHLHRIFTGCVGENIATYVRRVRLERAGRKLRMGAVDITQVALAAGYQSHAAFGKAFKQQYGLSPREFRQLDCWTATLLLRRINAHEDSTD
jgi:AraC family transcriptional regulator